MENGFPPVPPSPPPQAAPEAQPQIAPPPGTEPQPHPADHQLVAPIWHTLIILAFILFSSYLSSVKLGAPKNSSHTRLLLYTSTIVQDLVLLAFIWFGLWRKRVKLRDLIGGLWDPIDLLVDVALAAGFWVVSLMFLVAIRLSMVRMHWIDDPSIDSVKNTLGPLLPQSFMDLPLYILLALTAGFFEEILFRGYLQKQLSAITRSGYAGLVISGVFFGAAHGYQGAQMMIVLAIYGMMFGLLAHFRKNLRPGMIAHAWQDSIAGIAFFILTKYKRI